MKQIDSAREVIAVLGGVSAVAALTGRQTGTVSAWQARFNSFPPSTFVVMTDALRKVRCRAPKSLWRQVEAAHA